MIQPFSQMKFGLSAPHPRAFPDADLPEIAFAGRSNAGKSSALNALTGRKKLARTSKTPGRTQAINFFENTHLRLADLPGYGFARVPAAQKAAWKHLIESYLTERSSLLGVVLIMDIRHPLTPFDQQLLDWGAAIGLPFHLLLTKADKFSRNKQINTLREVEKQVRPHSVQAFSATKNIGLDLCKQRLGAWLDAASTGI